METNKLKKSSMAFELKSGEILFISNEDVQEIAGKILVEALLNGRSKMNITKNNTLGKCELLYKIVREQDRIMDDEQKKNYMKAILEFMTNENDLSFETQSEH